MSRPSEATLDTLWAHHSAQWRDSAQIVSQWREAQLTDPKLLDFQVRGEWWETLERLGITLLITREYEHLVMAVGTSQLKPRISFLPMPHPSGLAVDRKRATVFVASTRNPNQVYELRPASDNLGRLDMKCARSASGSPLLTARSIFLPGSLYIHDLALIGGELHANAVGHNAVVRLNHKGQFKRVWWPKCIELKGRPLFGRNHIQLNSIAAGKNVSDSFYSASAEAISVRRPGHKNFPVDRRGVIFSGRTREPMARGLTRPHSARLHKGHVWVDNSGYGEVGLAGKEIFHAVFRLQGWTRGLCFCKNIAFAGTSRVIPRFRQYAPGLDVAKSECGVHALDVRTGKVIGSILWPYGNQIFAVDWLFSRQSSGFPFRLGEKRGTRREKALFYSFELD